MGRPTLMIDEEQQLMMRHYLEVHQQSDGGWGTHIESPSTMFATVLCYVALRLLGWGSDSPEAKKAVKFIKDEGGAIMTSSWAKFWLCLLGCMEWEGKCFRSSNLTSLSKPQFNYLTASFCTFT